LDSQTWLISSSVIALANVPIVTSSTRYSSVGAGGLSLTASGDPSATTVGYAVFTPDSKDFVPPAFAIFGFRQNGILITEASVLASTPLMSGRIYAAIDGPEDTGIAFANVQTSPVTVTFYLTDANGNDFGQGSIIMSPGQQLARFLDQTPF